MQTELSSVASAGYAPQGSLRVALNFGNPVLVRRSADGRPIGLSVDLAAELARSLDLGFAFVEYERAADVTAAAGKDEWDLCFLAADPARRRSIAFTDPYVRISGCYLVGAAPAAITNAAVRAHALRIGVVTP